MAVLKTRSDPSVHECQTGKRSTTLRALNYLLKRSVSPVITKMEKYYIQRLKQQQEDTHTHLNISFHSHRVQSWRRAREPDRRPGGQGEGWRRGLISTEKPSTLFGLFLSQTERHSCWRRPGAPLLQGTRHVPC